MQRKCLPAAIAIVALFGGTTFGATENHAPVVSNVTAAQRGDGSNQVDVYYDLIDLDGDACTLWLEVSNDGGSTWGIPVFHVSGHVGESVASGTRRRIVWDAGTDEPSS